MTNNEPNDDGERGLIINISSIAAFENQIGQVAYADARRIGDDQRLLLPDPRGPALLAQVDR